MRRMRRMRRMGLLGRCIVPLLATAMAALQFAPAQAQTLGAGAPTRDSAQGLPRWEAGLATGGGRVSDYPGADESHLRGIVLPVFIYRGRVLRVDEGGVRGRLLDTPDFDVDLTGTAAFNARNNGARQGMPALDYLFGIGPQLIYKGWRDWPGSPSVHLKLRKVMSTDWRRIDSRGATFDPELRFHFRPAFASNARLTVSLQSTWATRGLQEYFYGVDPRYATTTRPAYSARSGYLGSELSVNLSRRVRPGLSWFVTAGAMSLDGAVNEASPLLRSRGSHSIGAGLVWTPWRSTVRVGD